jgi:hypothetical protein
MVRPPSSSRMKLIFRCCCRSDSCFRSPFPFLVIHSLLSSASCFDLLSLYPKTLYCLEVVHVSAPDSKLHVYISPNQRYRI